MPALEPGDENVPLTNVPKVLADKQRRDQLLTPPGSLAPRPPATGASGCSSGCSSTRSVAYPVPGALPGFTSPNSINFSMMG